VISSAVVVTKQPEIRSHIFGFSKSSPTTSVTQVLRKKVSIHKASEPVDEQGAKSQLTPSIQIPAPEIQYEQSLTITGSMSKEPCIELEDELVKICQPAASLFPQPYLEKRADPEVEETRTKRTDTRGSTVDDLTNREKAQETALSPDESDGLRSSQLSRYGKSMYPVGSNDSSSCRGRTIDQQEYKAMRRRIKMLETELASCQFQSPKKDQRQKDQARERKRKQEIPLPADERSPPGFDYDSGLDFEPQLTGDNDPDRPISGNRTRGRPPARRSRPDDSDAYTTLLHEHQTAVHLLQQTQVEEASANRLMIQNQQAVNQTFLQNQTNLTQSLLTQQAKVLEKVTISTGSAKLGDFNPKKHDWQDYFVQFKLCMVHHHWTAAEGFTQLALHLKGDALSLYADEGPTTLLELVNLLKTHYTSKSQTKAYLAEFRARKLRGDESIAEFSNAIKRLARRAWNKSSKELESNLIEKFLTGLGEPNLQNWLGLQDFDTLEEYENAAARYRRSKPHKLLTKPVTPVKEVKSKPTSKPRAAKAQAPLTPMIVQEVLPIQYSPTPSIQYSPTPSVQYSPTTQPLEEMMKKNQQQIMSMIGSTNKQVKDMQSAMKVASVPAVVHSPPAIVSQVPVAPVLVEPVPIVQPTVQAPAAPKPRPAWKKMTCLNCCQDHVFSLCPLFPGYKPNPEQSQWLKAAAEAKKTGTRIGPPPCNKTPMIAPHIKLQMQQNKAKSESRQPIAQPEEPQGDSPLSSDNDDEEYSTGEDETDDSDDLTSQDSDLN